MILSLEQEYKEIDFYIIPSLSTLMVADAHTLCMSSTRKKYLNALSSLRVFKQASNQAIPTSQGRIASAENRAKADSFLYQYAVVDH